MKQFLQISSIVAILAVSSAGAQSARTDSTSAPIRDIRYDVTFMRPNAQSRVVEVAMTFTTTSAAPVVLSLPAWTPGAYEISNFAHWVSGFEATADDKPLTWDKLDFDTWRVRPGGAKTVKVSFEYAADTLDNAMSWAKPDFLLFNGTNLFLYPEGLSPEFPASVRVHTESDWKVATGLGAGAAARSYQATNYHELVDMPFFIGRFDLDSSQISNRWVRLATYPAGTIVGQVRNTAWEQLRKVIPPEVAVFGEAPWPNYTVMQIVDSAYGGASGLEHASSHVDVLSPSYVGSEFQPSLYAHEIFHSWNVKRLRPSEMWPYRYSHAQPTPWLWVSEGITDYYADLAEVRGGVVEPQGFYALTAEKMNEVNNAPPVSLEDASVSTWVHPADGTGYLYYPKGSLAGLMLDIIIRDASDNKKSLDDVMRGLYQSTYKKGKGFTSAEWWSAVSAAANGKSFATFNSRYIDGREAFPWDSILPMAGLRARQQQVPRLGVLTQMDANGIIVANVNDGSSAAQAGVRSGDYLISVGDIPVEDQMFGAKMRAKYGASSPGAPLAIKIRRGGQEMTLQGKLQFGPGDIVVDQNPAASEKAVRIRTGILRGTTGSQ